MEKGWDGGHAPRLQPQAPSSFTLSQINPILAYA